MWSLPYRPSERGIEEKKRQNVIRKGRHGQLLPLKDLNSCDEYVQTHIQFFPEIGGNLQILLKRQLDFEDTSLILLDFAVRPNGSDLDAEIATLVIRVENVFEAPQLSDCQPAEGIQEDSSKAQLACTMLIETDAAQESLICNYMKASKWQYFVAVMNLTTSMINLSSLNHRVSIHPEISPQDVIDRRGRKQRRLGALLDVWKADGVTVDYETEPTIQGAVECFTQGQQVVSRNITLFVRDANEPPAFPYDLYELTILEGPVTQETRNATHVSMWAIDPDAAANLTYSILSESDADIQILFMIEANSGNLFAKIGVEFDRESQEWYNFTVIVSDGAHPSMNATTGVSIHILDKNDNSPVWTDPAQAALLDPLISEMPHGLQPPLLLYRFRAEEPDLGQAGVVQFTLADKLIWRSDGSNERQLLAATTESSGELRLLSELDRSFIDYALELTVAAHDSAPPFNDAQQNASIRFRIVSRGQQPELYFLLAVLSFLCILANLVLLFVIIRDLKGHSSEEDRNSLSQNNPTVDIASPPNASSESIRSGIESSQSMTSENGRSEGANSARGSSESAISEKGNSEIARSERGSSESGSS